MGVAAISKSYFSHSFDMSQTDLEQMGQAYLSQINTDSYSAYKTKKNIARPTTIYFILFFGLTTHR